MPARRPWYAFLYMILGAQGSFFAWIVALLGIYVMWGEALLFALNQSPRPTSVAQIVDDGPRWRRWVEVGGVEIDLGSALFAAGGGAGPAPGARRDTILIDRDDPAAIAWREVFREIETARPKLEGAGGASIDAELKRLHSILLRIGAERDRYVPRRALLIVEREAPAAPSSTATAAEAAPAPGAEDSLAERWRRDMRSRVDQVRAAVQIDVAGREGLLNPLPEERRRFFEDTYHVSLASSALSVGQHPSSFGAAVFAGCAVTLFFLAVGLRGGAGSP